MSEVTGWMVTPSMPRRTAPLSMSCVMTLRAMFAGIAKPMPMLPPERREDLRVDADQLAVACSPARRPSCPG